MVDISIESIIMYGIDRRLIKTTLPNKKEVRVCLVTVVTTDSKKHGLGSWDWIRSPYGSDYTLHDESLHQNL